MNIERFEQILQETGCDANVINQAWNLFQAGKKEDGMLHLKRHRSSLVDKMHESQRNVDKMDCLIRDAEKELQK